MQKGTKGAKLQPDFLALFDILAKLILRNLNLTSKEIEVSVVVTLVGLKICTPMSQNADPNRLGTMFVSILSDSKTTAHEHRSHKDIVRIE